MVSQDVEDSLSKRFFKWLFLSVLSLAIVLAIIILRSAKQTNLEISLFVALLLITLVTFLIAIFNLVIWLKIKSAIRTYHEGNYDKAKDIAISAYKLSNYREINELIDYIDSQIIDEKISQQERLEQETHSSDYLQDIEDLIEDIQLRIKRLEKIKQEINEKLEDLKQSDSKDNPELRSQYFDLINQYTDLSRFTDHKIEVYTEILHKLERLKQKHQDRDKIIREREDFKDLQEKILSEGYMTQDEDEEEEFLDLYRKEKIFLEYVKEFLASTMTLDNTEEFTRIYKEFNERLDDLKLN